MRRVVFVLPTYPDVMYSFLLAFAKQTDALIKIVCLGALLEEREGLYAEGELSSHAEIVFRSREKDLDTFARESIFENWEDVYVFGGFLGDVGRVLRLYHKIGGEKAVIITEKPSVRPARHFNALIQMLKRLKARWSYGKAYRAVARSIRAVLVTGEKGVKQLKSFGIPEDKLYNFMYTHIEENVLCEASPPSDKVRFVYVGRFNYLNRGMDALICTFEKIKQKNWTLTLVGGYGEDAEEIIAWATKKEGVYYLGAWKRDSVIKNLQDYDVCISPTRIDGWRVQVNQAIMAGIGTITTEEAISDELIKASDTGVVVDAFKRNALFHAVSELLESPSVVEKWKRNAMSYRACISNRKVAEYFNEILVCATTQGEKLKPRCPWL